MGSRLITLIMRRRFASIFTEAMRLARIRDLAGSFDEKAMTSAIDDFAKEAERVEKARLEAVRDSDRAKLAKINDALVQAERQFIDARGIARARVVQAPDLRTRFLYRLRRTAVDGFPSGA